MEKSGSWHNGICFGYSHKVGFAKHLYSRFGGARMSTLKELLDSGLAVEDILKAEAISPVL